MRLDAIKFHSSINNWTGGWRGSCRRVREVEKNRSGKMKASLTKWHNSKMRGTRCMERCAVSLRFCYLVAVWCVSSLFAIVNVVYTWLSLSDSLLSALFFSTLVAQFGRQKIKERTSRSEQYCSRTEWKRNKIHVSKQDKNRDWERRWE